jgi:hypothetical protein
MKLHMINMHAIYNYILQDAKSVITYGFDPMINIEKDNGDANEFFLHQEIILIDGMCGCICISYNISLLNGSILCYSKNMLQSMNIS